ncbi:hypothetical protein [Nocardioides sp. Iso805N]|uniref:hypothetical protein n=1 Tax=Nocardioides sp. Iso805N TaxID=1283287 RepID=UPI00036007B3|nr:hypothetical protein [Nocardioides sp. Iso805N]
MRGLAPAAVDEAVTRFIADGTVGPLEGWVQQSEPQGEEFMRLYIALLPTWWPGSQSIAGD